MKAIATTTAKINKSFLMSAAHALVKKFHITLSAALKKAWKACKLQAALKMGEVKFQFMKLDGTLRNAVGTLSAKLMGQYNAGSSRLTRVCYTAIPFFDMEKQEFRSFAIINLL